MGGCFLHRQEIPSKEKQLLTIKRLKKLSNIYMMLLHLRSSGEQAFKALGEAGIKVEVREDIVMPIRRFS